MIKITFIIPVKTVYRTLGPIIEAALAEDDIEVTLLLGPPLPKGSSKSYQSPNLDNIPDRLKGVKRICRPRTHEELLDMVQDADATLSIVGPRKIISMMEPSLEGNAPDGLMTNLRAASLWCAVFDAEHSAYDDHDFKGTSLKFWPSEYHLQKAIASHPEDDRQALEEGSHFVSYVRSGNIGLNTDAEIREAWNIPQDGPIVLYVPDAFRFKGHNHTTPWYSIIWCSQNRRKRLKKVIIHLRSPRPALDAMRPNYSFQDSIKAIRAFCDNNKARLLCANRRPKDCVGDVNLADEEKEAADHIVASWEDYPQALLQAIQISDLVICGYRSETAMDALAAGKPIITLGLPDRAFQQVCLDYNSWFDRENGNWPGLSWIVPAENFVRTLSSSSLKDFTPDTQALKNCRNQFVGPMDGKASQRILSIIHDHVASN